MKWMIQKIKAYFLWENRMIIVKKVLGFIMKVKSMNILKLSLKSNCFKKAFYLLIKFFFVIYKAFEEIDFKIFICY
jgi:hypothetical protein